MSLYKDFSQFGKRLFTEIILNEILIEFLKK